MRISVMAFAAMFIGVGIGQAQERGGEQGGQRGGGGFDPAAMVDRIFQADKNDDGKIAKDEADDRMLQMFDRADADKDGFMTREEVQKMFEQGPPEGGPGGPPGFGGPGGGPGGPGGGPGGPGGGRGGPERMMAMMPIIKALDADKNGEISMAEIENAVAALKTLDKNKDGSLSMEEIMPDPATMFGGGRGGRGGPGGPGGQNAPPRRPTFDDK